MSTRELMLDYDQEAERYDETRGGEPRAQAAATAIGSMLPSSRALTVVDLAGGTGIVAAALNTAGRRVVVLDQSAGMLGQAARRLPGCEVRATALALPLRDVSVDVVTCVWLLHLLASAEEVDVVLSEAGRVLRPGGRFVTTVDKDLASGFDRGSDPLDAADVVVAHAARHRLLPAGESSFVGPARGDGPDAVYRLLAFAKQRS
jgi:ubiquinone/menaquinone biosynthesis C-methylase UbiE